MTESRGCTRPRARAHAYTYICARGLPAYFGILIARGRPSPLLTPSRRALHPISPHLVSYLPRPCTPRLHPLDTLRRESSCFPPRDDVTHLPKTFAATSSHTCIFTCGDNNVRDVSHTHTDMYFFLCETSSLFAARLCNCDYIFSTIPGRDILIRLATRICGNYSLISFRERLSEYKNFIYS